MWKRVTLAGYSVALVVGVALAATYGAMEVSSTPAFCGSCHVMSPYFASWKTSSHNQIACVECHIEPGLTAEFRKKYEALSMVARYFTGTYGTNPWAEVEDAACLECHERRLLVGQELFGDVLFDHGPHLSELRRGKQLRCTSCHSQIVQGSHMTVTASTCILCHFKGQEANRGLARCTLCHEVPRGVVDAQGLAFDHGQVERFGMDCASCHPAPIAGSGGVPRERCVTCHNDPSRLAEYGEHDKLHRTHVSDHKVECTNCHLEIDHAPTRGHEEKGGECGDCHAGRHSLQRDLYAGIGGRDVEPRPDVMFQAGVRCEGCHAEHAAGDGDAAGEWGEIACMSCHGPSFRPIYRGWLDTLQARTRALGRALDSSARALPAAAGGPLDDARANYELVEKGRGVHNFHYSLAVLDAARSQIDAARRTGGLAPLPPLWAQPPYASPCFECHQGIEARTIRRSGRAFPHQPHVVGRSLDCQGCHSTHEEREASGAPAVLAAARDCNACHHRDAAADCESCHGTIRDRKLPVELGDFDHAWHVDDMELGCTDCHGAGPALHRKPDPIVCTDCH